MKLTANDVLLMHPTKRARVLDWVRAQGLEPDDVRSIRVVGPLIRAEVYVLDDQGGKQTHPDDAGRLTSVRVWTRMRWLWRKTTFPKLETIGGGA